MQELAEEIKTIQREIEVNANQIINNRNDERKLLEEEAILSKAMMILNRRHRPKHYAIIDTDGAILPGHWARHSTYLCGYVAIIVFDSNYALKHLQQWKLCFPVEWCCLLPRQQVVWKQASRSTHQCAFEEFIKNHTNQEDSAVRNDVLKILKQYDVDEIFSKGFFLDKRWLCDAACNNVYLPNSIIKSIVKLNHTFIWHDLNGFVNKVQGRHLPLNEVKQFFTQMKKDDLLNKI